MREIDFPRFVAWHGILFVLIAAFVGSAQAREEPAADATASFALSISYDPANDRLSIHAEDAPLSEVVRELGKTVPLEVRTQTEVILADPLSIEMNEVLLEDALKNVFADYSYTYIRMPDDVAEQSRSSLIILIARTTETPSEGKPGRSVSVAEDDSSNDLSKPENLFARQAAAENLSAALLASLYDGTDDPAKFFNDLDTLNRLDSEAALESMLEVMDDENTSSRARMRAAQALGQLGDEAAVPVLTKALEGADPAVSQVAAVSLARIGGDNATGTLMQAFKAADPKLNEIAAIAIGMHGDGYAKRQLQQVILAHDEPPETVPNDVMQALDRIN